MSVNRNLVLGFVVFSGLATVLFFLPKSVVESTKKLENIASSPIKEETSKPEALHASDSGLVTMISGLRKTAYAESNSNKKSELFQEMAKVFLKNHQYDSAGASYEKAASLTADPKLSFEAGSAYYEGITFAGNPSKVEFLSGKARDLFAQVPGKSPLSTEAQAKSAMTWVNSPSPMKGILKLRELSEKHPENEYVSFQLGMLSFQSGQFEKAVARFRKVLEINSKNVNAWFYLAQCLQQTGQKDEALKAINSGLPLAKEDDTKASFEELKKQLTEN